MGFDNCCILYSPIILLVVVEFLRGGLVDAADIDQAYFLGGGCSQVIGPLHSLTVKVIDREDLEEGEFHRPPDDVDCSITFTSNTFTDSLTRKISIKARSAYYSVSNPSTCERPSSGSSTEKSCLDSNAYLQVYYGGGNSEGFEYIGTYCDSSPPPYMEAPTQYTSVTIRLVINSYVSPTTDISITGALTENTDTTQSGELTTTVQNMSSTLDIDTTTFSDNNLTTTDNPSISNCGANFTIDITSFIVGNCHQDGRQNNKYQWYCEKEDKCLSKALKCDGYLANNCGDYSDNSAGKPSRCGGDNLSVPFLWLWILIATLCLLLFLYWCLWRPGWLVWRCGSLRNCCYDTNCYSCSAKCNTRCCRPCISAASNNSELCGGERSANSGGTSDRNRAWTSEGQTDGKSSDSQRRQRGRAQRRGGMAAGVCCCCPSSKVGSERITENIQGRGNAPDVEEWTRFYSEGGVHLRRHRY